jgi:hypothetical protein
VITTPGPAKRIAAASPPGWAGSVAIVGLIRRTWLSTAAAASEVEGRR